MKINTNSFVFPWLSLPVFAPADEGTAGATEGDTNTGGDAGDATGDTGGDTAANQGEGAADAAPKSVLDGGTAEGQDNSGEGEGDGTTSGDEGDKAEGDEPAAEVPDEYDYSVAMPEGMEMDQGLADAVSPVFKEMGLTQDQAVKLTQAYAAHIQATADEQGRMINDTMEGWVSTAKADKEIGHAAWNESVQNANKALREFGTPELLDDVMIQQGMGNHPEVIRIFARIGKAISDDSLVTGKSTDTGEAAPRENLWYGETTPTSKKG